MVAIRCDVRPFSQGQSLTRLRCVRCHPQVAAALPVVGGTSELKQSLKRSCRCNANDVFVPQRIFIYFYTQLWYSGARLIVALRVFSQVRLMSFPASCQAACIIPRPAIMCCTCVLPASVKQLSLRKSAGASSSGLFCA